MKITILPLKEVQTYRPTQPSYLIRIFGNKASYNEYFNMAGSFTRKVVYFFDDVDLYSEAKQGKNHLKEIIQSENPQIFHKELALKIISEFDKCRTDESFEELVVHCYVGAGRSPAVAIALNEIFQLGCKTTDLINSYPEYNEYVFDVMVQASKDYVFVTE